MRQQISGSSKGTSQVSKRSGLYPLVRVDAAAVPAVAHAGGALVSRTAHASGLGAALREALGPWRKPLARHDPAKVVLDVATSPALGGDACADTALLRAEPGLYGPVALDPTISRTIAALAADIHRVEQAVATARVRARAHVGASRASRVKPRGHGRETAGQRCGCDAGDGAQRQKERGADVQTGYGFHRCARSSITVRACQMVCVSGGFLDLKELDCEHDR